MKNKLLHFALDLFCASDDDEQDSIFAQVKIYRTASVRIFEYIIGILLLAIWLLIIRNIIHAAAEEWHSYLIVAIRSIGGKHTRQARPDAVDTLRGVRRRHILFLSSSYQRGSATHNGNAQVEPSPGSWTSICRNKDG